MRLHGVNNLTKPFPAEVGSSVYGMQFDSVEFDQKDMARLMALSSLELREYMSRLSTKMRVKPNV